MNPLGAKPLPPELLNHFNIYGKMCCINHAHQNVGDTLDHLDSCCAWHHPETVVLEFDDKAFMALLPEYEQTHRLVAITGPIDRLGKFRKAVLEPKGP